MKKFELKNSLNSISKFRKFEISKKKQKSLKGGNDIIIDDIVDNIIIDDIVDN